MSAGDNLDASLSTLAGEINALTAQGKGVQLELGRRVIAVRELLAIRNGENPAGNRGKDGRRPIGWTQWVQDNLTCTHSHAVQCMGLAVQPGHMQHRASLQANRRKTAPYLKRQILNVLPGLDKEEQRKIVALVISILESAA